MQCDFEAYLNGRKNLIAKSSADHLCQPKDVRGNFFLHLSTLCTNCKLYIIHYLPVCICGEDALEESIPPNSDVLLLHEDCHLEDQDQNDYDQDQDQDQD